MARLYPELRVALGMTHFKRFPQRGKTRKIEGVTFEIHRAKSNKEKPD
jgi:hypothetical protein